jgi:hypothetical protein
VKTFIVKRDMEVYIIDLSKEICKPGLKLDFTALGIMESLSDFGLYKALHNKYSFSFACVPGTLPSTGNSEFLLHFDV